jgi:hypothetical protein
MNEEQYDRELLDYSQSISDHVFWENRNDYQELLKSTD